MIIRIFYLHLLVPTFEDPANQGSRMKIHLNVSHLLMPLSKAGLSLSLSPFLNQCTLCFLLEPLFVSLFMITMLFSTFLQYQINIRLSNQGNISVSFTVARLENLHESLCCTQKYYVIPRRTQLSWAHTSPMPLTSSVSLLLHLSLSVYQTLLLDSNTDLLLADKELNLSSDWSCITRLHDCSHCEKHGYVG